MPVWATIFLRVMCLESLSAFDSYKSFVSVWTRNMAISKQLYAKISHHFYVNHQTFEVYRGSSESCVQTFYKNGQTHRLRFWVLNKAEAINIVVWSFSTASNWNGHNNNLWQLFSLRSKNDCYFVNLLTV